MPSTQQDRKVALTTCRSRYHVANRSQSHMALDFRGARPTLDDSDGCIDPRGRVDTVAVSGSSELPPGRRSVGPAEKEALLSDQAISKPVGALMASVSP
jgi:hypothetical protein